MDYGTGLKKSQGRGASLSVCYAVDNISVSMGLYGCGEVDQDELMRCVLPVGEL